ncbi:short-chain-enoyl-CoA hydratase [Glutamicibacter endophyticus]
MEHFETLTLETRENALIVTIDRPESLNALALEVVADLERLVNWLSDSGFSYRGIVLTGAGSKAFVAGANIVQMNEMSPEQAQAYGQRMHAVTLALEELQIPVIAAVNGFALGGGCELALACDFIYASQNASFGQPEVNLGLVPGFGGSVRLPRRIGAGMARELIFTGRRIDAAEALRIGLVNRVVPGEELLESTVQTINDIAKVAPTAVANAKRAMVRMEGQDTATALQIEAESFREAFTTADSVEGRAAFVQKRAAQFEGK